jgi:hypothetical protein
MACIRIGRVRLERAGTRNGVGEPVRLASRSVDRIFTGLAFMIAPASSRLGKAPMNDNRYSMKIGNIGQQEIDLLECLVRIDLGQALDARAADLCRRLIEGGLVQDADDELVLTPAGIERCRSLKHRVAGDKEAAKVIADRGIALAGMPLHEP